MLISGIFFFFWVCVFLCFSCWLFCLFVCFKERKEQSWVGRIWEELDEEKCLIKLYLRKFVS